MKDNFKRKLWISLGIIIGSVVLASVGLYILSGSITGAADKVIADRTLVRSQTTALSSLASLKHDAPVAAKYVDAINKLVPDQYALVTFGQWLQVLAGKYGVTTHFSFQGTPATPAPGSAGTAAFIADAEGSVTNLTLFMKDLEAQAPGFLLSLNTFDLTDDGVNSRVIVQGILYFR